MFQKVKVHVMNFSPEEYKILKRPGVGVKVQLNDEYCQTILPGEFVRTENREKPEDFFLSYVEEKKEFSDWESFFEFVCQEKDSKGVAELFQELENTYLEDFETHGFVALQMSPVPSIDDVNPKQFVKRPKN